MSQRNSVVSFLAVASVFLFVFLVSGKSFYEAPVFSFNISNSPSLSVKAWGLFNVENGEIYIGENISEVLPIASVTKLRTAEILLNSDIQTATTTIKYGDVAVEGRAGKLHIGDKIQTGTLIFPLLLESSNDSAEAIARVYGKEEFLTKMNDNTLEGTTFTDFSGLSFGNESTVEELAEYTSRLFKNKRHIFDITTLSQYINEDYGWLNNSPVYKIEGYQGGKHGFTNIAKHTLVAVFQFNISGGPSKNIGLILLGSDDLVADTNTLRTFVNNNTQYK